MNKLAKILTYSIFMILVFVSCARNFPEKLPDFGKEIDISKVNKSIKISLPPNGNTFKNGDLVSIYLENLTETAWNLDIKEGIFIYRVIDNNWAQVKDDANVIGPTNFVIEPIGVFPGDRKVIAVLPSLKSDTPVLVRIFVLVQKQLPDEGSQYSLSYVDVYLK
ncbi:MAG: hypothetical protein WCK35_20625 [Chloroflexota bacterium]